jgi:putative transposase
MAETKRMTTEQVVGYLLEGEGLDFLRESLTWVVQQLMEAEVSELVGAARGERAPEERLTHRNGYRARAGATRAGEIELAIPKLRRGSYFPSFLEPRRRSEQSLVSVVQEAYVAGVSTRKVDQVVESLGLRISKSEVSRICAGLDEQSTPSATARLRAAARTCGWTPRWRRSATVAASCASASCSPTACTSPATAR